MNQDLANTITYKGVLLSEVPKMASKIAEQEQTIQALRDSQAESDKIIESLGQESDHFCKQADELRSQLAAERRVSAQLAETLKLVRGLPLPWFPHAPLMSFREWSELWVKMDSALAQWNAQTPEDKEGATSELTHDHHTRGRLPEVRGVAEPWKMSDDASRDPVNLGILGPGKSLYEQYRVHWKLYKHPLPEWSRLDWRSIDIWNLLAVELVTAERERCAKIALNLMTANQSQGWEDWDSACQEIAAAIRSGE